MNILILSKWGGGTSLGSRLVKEGHKVRMWIEEDKYKHVGDGFVEKVDSYHPHKKWANLIVFDDGSGLGKISENLKKENLVIWGGDAWSDEIELDRGKGQAVLKSIGMKVIPHFDFTSLEDGLAFVKKNPKRYVAKPSGTIQDEKALTYLGKLDDGSDMISILEQYKAKWSGKITKFELQEFKKGTEVGISGFFNGKDFVKPIEISFEHKKLMAGDNGPSSGEMGTSMVWMGKNKIYRESIGRMVPLLREHKYTGYLDINCIAEGETLWPLEFTNRFGYPTIHLKMETIKGNMGNWMFDVARGIQQDFKVSNPYSVCVVVATPPYPFSAKDLYKKYGEDSKVIFKGKDRTGIWPGEIRKEGEDWMVTGENGFSLICTGQGKSIKEAQEMAYKRVDSVILPNSFYRNDIAEKTQEQLEKLNSWGYFKP